MCEVHDSVTTVELVTIQLLCLLFAGFHLCSKAIINPRPLARVPAVLYGPYIFVQKHSNGETAHPLKFSDSATQST